MAGVVLPCLLTILLSVTKLAASADSYDSVVLQLLGSKYTVFVKLLDEANVLTEIEQGGHLAKGITVFAPSDRYLMENVPPNVLTFLTQPQNLGMLRKVLKNHIGYGKASEASFYTSDLVETLSGEKIQLCLDGDSLKAGSTIVKELSTLESADGLVHTVQGLMIPKDVLQAVDSAISEEGEGERRSLVTFPTYQAASAPAPAPAQNISDLITSALTDAKNYGTLLSLLNLGLLNNISQLVEKGQPLTLAAPDDNAFSELGSTVGKINQTETIDVLLYHVFLGAYSFNDLAAIGNGSYSFAPSPEASPTSRRLLASSSSGTLQSLSNEMVVVETNATSSGLPSVTIGDGGLIISPDILDGFKGISIQGISLVLVPPGLVSTPPPVTSPITYGGPPPVAPPPPSSGTVHNIVPAVLHSTQFQSLQLFSGFKVGVGFTFLITLMLLPLVLV